MDPGRSRWFLMILAAVVFALSLQVTASARGLSSAQMEANVWIRADKSPSVKGEEAVRSRPGNVAADYSHGQRFLHWSNVVVKHRRRPPPAPKRNGPTSYFRPSPPSPPPPAYYIHSSPPPPAYYFHPSPPPPPPAY